MTAFFCKLRASHLEALSCFVNMVALQGNQRSPARQVGRPGADEGNLWLYLTSLLTPALRQEAK